MKHYYIINHDTQQNRWGFDWDATQDAFGIATMLDTDTGEWVRTSPENASEHPDETRLTDQLGAIFAQLNTNNQVSDSTDKWLLALHEVARLITQDGDESSDGQCIDDVWAYLARLGIDVEAYRPKTAKEAMAANDGEPVAPCWYCSTHTDEYELDQNELCEHCAESFEAGVLMGQLEPLPNEPARDEPSRSPELAATPNLPCDTCGAVVFVVVSDPTREGRHCWDCYWKPAPLSIADASDVAASPVLTASATPPLRSAVKTFNNCDGGDPQGWAVLCSDMSGQWIEAGFNDEAGADRFAEHYCAYDSDTAASVGLLVWADRSIWDNLEERSGAHVVIVWEDSGDELAVYISFEEDDETRPDDEAIFYYSTAEEWEQLSQGETHSDGWYIQEVKNYTQKEG